MTQLLDLTHDALVAVLYLLDEEDLDRFLKTAKCVQHLRDDSILRALWLAEHRPQEALFDAAAPLDMRGVPQQPDFLGKVLDVLERRYGADDVASVILPAPRALQIAAERSETPVAVIRRLLHAVRSGFQGGAPYDVVREAIRSSVFAACVRATDDVVMELLSAPFVRRELTEPFMEVNPLFVLHRMERTHILLALLHKIFVEGWEDAKPWCEGCGILCILECSGGAEDLALARFLKHALLSGAATVHVVHPYVFALCARGHPQAALEFLDAPVVRGLLRATFPEMNPLRLACEEGRTDLAVSLVRAVTAPEPAWRECASWVDDCGSLDYLSGAPLAFACRAGDVRAVRCLLDAGAKLHRDDVRHMGRGNALHAACSARGGDAPACVEAVLHELACRGEDVSAFVNAQEAGTRMTPFHYLIDNTNVQASCKARVTHLLCACGARNDIRDAQGRPPLV